MKSIKILLIALFSISMASCTFTENIYVNDDGTGKFSFDMDASALMAMMPDDSIKTQKAVDSTFTFKELFKDKQDSIAKLSKEEQAKIKVLENFTVRTKMDPIQKQFMFSLGSSFKNISEMQDAMSVMEKVQNSKKGSNDDNPFMTAAGGSFGNNNSELKYFYDGKKFSRKANLLNKDILKVENDSTEESMKMIYESSTYVMKYHFPKRVKKVSNESALYSEDRKTVTIEFPFSDYMSDPQKLNIEVEFEK